MLWINRAILALLVTSLIAFSLLPAVQNSPVVAWACILLITGCALYLALVYHRPLSTWHGFGILAVLTFLALTWLRWQRPLWPPLAPHIQTVNLIVGLLTWVLLIALFASTILLLVHKDASILFMALAWVLLPTILIAVGNQYPHLNAFNQAPLGEQAFWGIPLLWTLTVLCLGPLAFLAHLLALLAKELGGSDQ
jgi:hypothetical protein